MGTTKKIARKEIQGIHGLSPIQVGMLFHYLGEPGTDLYFEQLSLDISGEIHRQPFEQAWQSVVEANEALRTVFRWEHLENPVQIILTSNHFQPRCVDFSHLGIHEAKQRLEETKTLDRKEGFRLNEVPFRVTLVKLSEHHHVMIISHHHILYDGWSSGILLAEFFAAYHACRQGKPVVTHAENPRLKEVLKWRQKLDPREEENFWRNYLAGYTPLTGKLGQSGQTIKTVRGRPNALATVIKNEQWVLDRETELRLVNLLKEHRQTPAAFFYCAWGILLQKYYNSDDVLFGATVSGRTAPVRGLEKMVGLLINTLPLRIKTGKGETVTRLLSELGTGLPVWEKHDRANLAEIKKYVPGETAGEMFNTLVVVENYPLEIRAAILGSGLGVGSYTMWESTHYDIALRISTTSPLTIDMIYNQDAIGHETMARLKDHFKRIVEEMTAFPWKAIQELEILTPREKKQLLWDFNDIGPAYPTVDTIPGLFMSQVERTPEYIALTWNHALGKSNPSGQVALTYSELNKKANCLAALLMEKGVRPRTTVGLNVERSIEMMIGILGILKTGAAYLPINPGNPKERTDYMLTDSRVDILVTGETLAEMYSAFYSSYWSYIPTGSTLAYIIYTSGSTGRPKGVPITHANFSPLLHWGYEHLGLGASDRVVQNLSYYFDWSVWEMFIALTTGARLVMVTGEIILEGKRYVEFLNRERITVLHITPTHFQVLTQAGMRLTSLTHLCLGAEKLSVDLARRSFECVGEECRVFNMYGPTEATIMAAVLEIDKANLSLYQGLSSVPVGKPVGNTQLFVLDRYLYPCPVEVAGELFIGGQGLANGYLNNPELTAWTFINYQEFYKSDESYMSYISKKLYKTGDLARWHSDATIEFLGRTDNQVKIRGNRIEPGEIEKYVLELPGVKEALVIARQDIHGENYLCAYIVPQTPRPENLSPREKLLQMLPAVMVPSVFVEIPVMPLNANGKVDLNALPAPEMMTSKAPVPPRNPLEEKLAGLWARVLGIDATKIGIDDDFFELGGHSLNVTTLIGRIHKEMQVEIPFTGFFSGPTVRELARNIARTENNRVDDIPPVEKKEYYPLSSEQRRLFVLQQMAVGGTAYNIHGVMHVDGRLEKEKLELVLKRLIERHESLRTSFYMLHDEPVQRVHEDVSFDILFHHVYGNGTVPALDFFIRPFDLSRAPLLRMGIIETERDTTLLMVDMHHIIADGASVNVLIEDFTAFYGGEELPAPQLQYKDFSHWQNYRQDREKKKRQEAFWLNELAGEKPSLNLPLDYVRPLVQDFAGTTLEFEIPPEQVQQLKELAQETKTTLFMVILAIYTIFLAKISGQEDIVVGTPVANRLHPGIERIIGMFVNTLPLRNYPLRHQTAAEFLAQLKDRTLHAFENQEYPYEEMVELLNVSRDSGRNPLFDTMFTLRDRESTGSTGSTGSSGLSIRGLKLKPYRYEENTSKFDMSLIGEEKGKRLVFTLEYSTKLFRQETIEHWISYFMQLVTSVLEDSGKKIAELRLMPENEVRQILEGFNHPVQPYPRKTVADLFAEQVAKAPYRIACVDEGNYLTFEELDNRANVLAGIIKEL